MGDTPVEVALSMRAQHAEGPLWDAATASLWWVDITGQRVHRFDPESSNDSSWSTAGQPGGVVLDAHGEPVVPAPEGLAVLDLSTGALDLRVPISRTGRRTAQTTSRSTAVAGRGSARWLSISVRAAPLYRVEAGKANCVVDGLTISNGPAFDEVQGLLTSPIPPVRLTCSTWSRKRACCPVAGASLISVTNRSGPTA